MLLSSLSLKKSGWKPSIDTAHTLLMMNVQKEMLVIDKASILGWLTTSTWSLDGTTTTDWSSKPFLLVKLALFLSSVEEDMFIIILFSNSDSLVLSNWMMSDECFSAHADILLVKIIRCLKPRCWLDRCALVLDYFYYSPSYRMKCSNYPFRTWPFCFALWSHFTAEFSDQGF